MIFKGDVNLRCIIPNKWALLINSQIFIGRFMDKEAGCCLIKQMIK